MKKQRRKNRKFATVKPVEQVPAREYIYSFELSRQFPNVRSFIFKKSLSKSMMDNSWNYSALRRNARVHKNEGWAMKVVLVGNGAREHIIAERLAEDCELYSVMSRKNPAIAQLSKKHWVCDIENPDAVRNAIKGIEFDLGFASPDAVLAAGISDVLSSMGMLVSSPSKAASRIEWDKSFMRALLDKHRVNGSPKHKVLSDPEEATQLIKDLGEVAIKPLGLTGERACA